MKIITDTSALYSPKEGEAKDLGVLPLSVTVNDHTYTEFVDIDSDQFLDLLKDGSVPRSSQPSIGETIDVFENIDDEMLVLTMGDGLSGTYQSTVAAMNSVKNKIIKVIDTKTLCGPHRYVVQKAMQLKEQKMNMEDIVNKLQDSLDHTKSFLIPQDFSFLERGGRLTPIAAKVGGMLKIVPIMTLTEDAKKLEVHGVKRTMKSAISEIINTFNDMNIDENYIIYVSHAGVREQAEKVASQLRAKFNNIKIEILELSPVFITQGGPGCIAVQMIKM